jgi:hypothetical protein
MVDVETPPAKPAKSTTDPATRRAALWATVIAVPIAVIVGLVAFSQFTPDDSEPAAAPSASAPAPVPTTPVQLAAAKLDARTTQVCLAVTSQLPTELRGLTGRKVTAGPEQNAAWGEPPITLECGVTQPTMCERIDGGHDGCVPLDSTMLAMDGVCWWAEDGPATDVFTTMDREVAVRVSVPGSYEQTGQWANEFSEPVVKTVKSTTKGVPSGCKG